MSMQRNNSRRGRRSAPRIDIKQAAKIAVVLVAVFGQPLGERIVDAAWPRRAPVIPPKIIVNGAKGAPSPQRTAATRNTPAAREADADSRVASGETVSAVPTDETQTASLAILARFTSRTAATRSAERLASAEMDVRCKCGKTPVKPRWNGEPATPAYRTPRGPAKT
jgi:hypothetical protein